MRLGVLAVVVASAMGWTAPLALAEPAATGVFGGVIFGDQNENGVRDADESGLSGVQISIFGAGVPGWYSQTTDSAGRFSFTDIPVGHYTVSYPMPPSPWAIFGLTGNEPDTLDLDQSDAKANVAIRAVPQLWNTLDFRLIPDRTSYQPGDTMRIAAVFTNRRDRPLTGVVVTCTDDPNGPSLRGGPGWGPLVPGGPGLTVEAGKSRSVVVTEQVPPDAPRFGYLSVVGCSASAAGHPQGDVVNLAFVSTPRVPGVRANGGNRIYDDRNDNFMVDAGEEVAGASVAVLDPDTGAEVTRAVTDAAGAFTVTDLPAANYRLRVLGPWQPRRDSALFQFPVVAGDTTAPQAFAVKAGAANLEYPNVKLTAAFDKPAYNSGDVVRATVTVSNIGGAPATGVWIGTDQTNTAFSYDPLVWGEFDTPDPGGRLEPGATKTVQLNGPLYDPAAGVVTLSALVLRVTDDADISNNGVQLAAPVTETRGSYTGILYGDRNNNGLLDPGEALPSVAIQLTGGVPHGTVTATADTAGRFAFHDVPTGSYVAHYLMPDPWLVEDKFQTVTIDEADHPPTLVRAALPLSNFLTATVKFAKRSYVPGETAHLTMTLTNTGTVDLPGIIALCNMPGFDNEIGDDIAGWGDLADEKRGVTVPAGATRTYNVTSVIPDGAAVWGWVGASCPVRTDAQPGFSEAFDRASVPGLRGTTSGTLVFDRNADGHFDGDGVAGTKVVLMDAGTVVARAVTDAGGRFAFADVPAGDYEFRVIGPWKLVDAWDRGLSVRGGKTNDHGPVRVVPGAVQPDPDTGHPADGGPAPQGGVAPPATHLASTGASVVGWTVGGLAALGSGLVLLLFRRRGAAG